MDRDVNAPFSESDAWRVAALSMMGADELRVVFSGNEAAPWVIAAANGGLADAQVRLGRMLLSGEGIAKDEANAFAWFARAAEADHTEAHNMLGRCYESGWGTAQDFAKAARHYSIAADAGDAWAQYNLAHLYLDGNGVARDLDRAFALYAQASAQGHVRAINLLARCYEEGWGTMRDAALARAWYRKSAEGGYFRGAYNYATMLAAEGCMAGAAKWFTKAIVTSPASTRATMIAALIRSPHRALREVALGMDAQTGTTEGLI